MRQGDEARRQAEAQHTPLSEQGRAPSSAAVTASTSRVRARRLTRHRTPLYSSLSRSGPRSAAQLTQPPRYTNPAKTTAAGLMWRRYSATRPVMHAAVRRKMYQA